MLLAYSHFDLGVQHVMLYGRLTCHVSDMPCPRCFPVSLPEVEAVMRALTPDPPF